MFARPGRADVWRSGTYRRVLVLHFWTQLLELLYPMVTAGLAACCAFSNKTKQLGVVVMLVDTLHVSYTSISISVFELCLHVVYSSETT